MSFVFWGSRGDIENGFSGIIPEPRSLRVQSVRPVNANSLAFLLTVLLLFTILNSHQMSPNFLLLVVLGVFLIATSLRMYTTCQQLQAQAQAHAAAASSLFGHTGFRFQMPPSIALSGRGRLQGLGLQLALLDREFDELDYETLRALDPEIISSAYSMSDDEINALPVHKYKVTKEEREDSASHEASSSSLSPQKKEDAKSGKILEEGMTCSICLEQVHLGDLIRTLPCLHQFHASCIDPWLRRQGTCPVCKLRVGSEMQDDLDNYSEAEVADMV